MHDAAYDALLATLEQTEADPQRQPDEFDIREMLWEDGLLTATAVRPEQPDLHALTALMVEPDEDADIALAMHALNDIRVKHIKSRLRRLGPRYFPVSLDHPDEPVALTRAATWAIGFVKGMSLAAEAWAPVLADPVGRDAIIPILTFVSRSNGASVLGQTLPGELIQMRRDAFTCLGESVFKLHLLLQEHREDARRHGGRLGKVGRNEPCPCGSGQKYKKCCLN